MKKRYLWILGFMPLGLGFILHWLMLQFPSSTFPFDWAGVAFLVVWALLGFVTYRVAVSVRTSLCIVHLGALLMLILNLYQELVLGQYWGNLLSLCTQLFYLPMLRISFGLTTWSNRVWPAYIVSFLLMCLAYFIGWSMKKKRIAQAGSP